MEPERRIVLSRSKVGGAIVLRRAAPIAPAPVRVRRRGERRRDFLRRHHFRGVDELRRQQVDDDPMEPPPKSLDVMI